MKNKVPKLRTDKEAEEFLEQDLSDLDFSQFKPVRFVFEVEKKDEQLNMRIPKSLLDAVKTMAKVRGIPYTRFIRETLERSLQQQPLAKESKTFLIGRNAETGRIGRNAETGRLIPVEKARAKPASHVVERMPKAGNGDTNSGKKK